MDQYVAGSQRSADGRRCQGTEAMIHEDKCDHGDLEGHPDGPEGEDIGRHRIAASPEVIAVVDEHRSGEHHRGDAEDALIPILGH